MECTSVGIVTVDFFNARSQRNFAATHRNFVEQPTARRNFDGKALNRKGYVLISVGPEIERNFDEITIKWYVGEEA